jgi:hypothetical protein
MDDVTPLRQAADAIAAGGNYLFAPAAVYRLRPGNDEGTPLPLDEPHADNPATGAYVDYYLAKAARTPVVIAFANADGNVLRRASSADKPTTIDPDRITVVPSWISPVPLPSATTGAHRFVWDFATADGTGPLAPPGVYTVTLTVDGKTFSRSERILRDPRIAASDADLRAQYDFARSIESLRRQVGIARARAANVAPGRLSPDQRRTLRLDIVGAAPVDNPDDSMGAYSHDFTSFLYLQGALAYLESAVESGDAAPTPDMRGAYRKLETIYRTTLTRLSALETAPASAP